MVLFPQLFPALLLKVTGYIARPRLPFTLSISSLPFVWLHGVSVKFLLCAAVDLSVQFALNEKRKKKKKRKDECCFGFKGRIFHTCAIVHAESLWKCSSHFSAWMPFSKPTGFRWILNHSMCFTLSTFSPSLPLSLSLSLRPLRSRAGMINLYAHLPNHPCLLSPPPPSSSLF